MWLIIKPVGSQLSGEWNRCLFNFVPSSSACFSFSPFVVVSLSQRNKKLSLLKRKKNNKDKVFFVPNCYFITSMKTSRNGRKQIISNRWNFQRKKNTFAIQMKNQFISNLPLPASNQAWCWKKPPSWATLHFGKKTRCKTL